MQHETLRRCAECGRLIEALKATAVYCGDRCRKRAYYARNSERLAPTYVRYRKVHTGRTTEEKRKAAAQLLAQRAIRAGRLTREPCLFCDGEPVDAHHHDYDQPLSVTWLCRRHHRRVHESHGRVAD